MSTILSSNDKLTLNTFSMQHIESSSKYNTNIQNNSSIINSKEVLIEQKTYFKDNGLITDKYLLP